MIVSFADKDTADLFAGRRVKHFANIASVAERKLQQLDSAVKLEGLARTPETAWKPFPATVRQHSIRINDQWRLCFVWRDDGVHDVEIVDYH